MKKTISVLILLFTTHTFAVNTNSQPKFEDIISSIQMDLDGDHYVDTAYLAKPNDSALEDLDLWVKLSSKKQYFKVQGVTFNMTNGMAGLETSLKLNPAGSLQVYAINDAIGRGRWNETITFAYRNGQIVLAGYTHNNRDTITLEYMKCDVNVLTKFGTVHSDKGDGSFELNSEDVLTATEATSINLVDLYLHKYCYGTTSDMDGGDL